MNATSATVAPHVDEFEVAGLTGRPSVEVAPDRVEGAPVSFECVVTQVVQLQTRTGEAVSAWLTLGEVVGVHIDTGLLVDGVYQTAAAHPVVRGGGPSAYFEIGAEARFDLTRPG